jgi:serine/threonine protein phosphatase PrpC
VWIRGDGAVVLRPLDHDLVDAPTPFPIGEAASAEADVLGAAVTLIEAMLGVPWPVDVPPDRITPYLRAAVPDLPASALAPIDAALHPTPELRPRNGAAWLDMWARSATAEEARRLAENDDSPRWDVGYDSHVGIAKLLVTQTNQDALFVGVEGSQALLVVCDGISTSSAGTGDQASGITAHVLGSLWEQRREALAGASKGEILAFLERALRLANQAVCEAALRMAGGTLDGRVPMGTTCVAALVRGNRVFLAWLGDSRAYLVGGYGASLLTADHNQSLSHLLLYQADGRAHWDPTGYALTSFVGSFDDQFRPDPIPMSHRSFRIRPGERLVLCSDGVTDYIASTHPDVSAAIRRAAFAGDPPLAARALVDLANRGGGGDNATAIVAALRGG